MKKGRDQEYKKKKKGEKEQDIGKVIFWVGEVGLCGDVEMGWQPRWVEQKPPGLGGATAGTVEPSPVCCQWGGSPGGGGRWVNDAGEDKED